MDFQTKVDLTKEKVFTVYPNSKVLALSFFDEKLLTKNYRNKTIYSFNSIPNDTTFQLIAIEHVNIIQQILAKVSNLGGIKDLFIKTNSMCQNQLCFTINEDNLGETKIEEFIGAILEMIEVKNPIVSVYYRIYNQETKTQFNTKDIEQIPFDFERSNAKLIEEVLGIRLYLSPYTFSRINTFISPKIYEQVHNLAGGEINNIILYGRDVYYLAKYYAKLGKFPTLAVTHCKITYQDIITDMDLDLVVNPDKCINLAIEFCHKKDYVKTLNKFQNAKQKSCVILTAGRNGLSRDLIDYFIENTTIMQIIYIACNRDTMGRDLAILNKSFTLNNCVIIDEFPNTEYNNTILELFRSKNKKSL